MNIFNGLNRRASLFHRRNTTGVNLWMEVSAVLYYVDGIQETSPCRILHPLSHSNLDQVPSGDI